MQLSGAQLIIEALKVEGVNRIFGVSSSPTLSIMDVLYHEPQIRYIQTNHEQNAMYMANGYARATRTPGVCLVGPGPATTHCVSAVAQAYYTCAPCVLIGVEYPTRTHGLGSAIHHDLDAVPIFKPVTKLSLRVHRVDRIVESLQMAFRTALSGRNGPVYIGIARDTLTNMVDVEVPAPQKYRVAYTHPADPAAVARAVELLAAAERPAALIGGGAAGALDVLLELAGRLAMPMAATRHNKGIIPEDHPLALGTLGNLSTKAMQEADVLLAVGCTFDQFTTKGFGHKVMPQNAGIIQVNIDPTEIGKIYPVDVGLLGDAFSVLTGLLEGIRGKKVDRRPVEQNRRIQELLREKRQRQESFLPLQTSSQVPIHRMRLLHDLRKALPRDAIVAGESGSTHGWFLYGFESLAHNCAVGGWHSLGAEFVESMGVKVAFPDRIVTCVTGDGSMMATLHELVTAVAQDIRLLCVVCHNDIFGNMRHTQIKQFGGRFISTDLLIPNLSKVAREFGAYGERVSSPDEIIPAVGRAIDSGKPALLEIMIDASPENLVAPGH
ncbi:MAG: thiamine pyrophosphate-binding protein [Desulfobacterales bacterium]|nr:thiamine pyrophosphate-binding protein [Desulfobacterales bacterium]